MQQLLPLKGFKLFFLSMAIGMGTLLISVDSFIANVAIPTIAGDLGVSTDEGSWVVTSFTVANAMVVPLTGWLGARFGLVRLFTFSTLAFSFMSWVCGISFTLPMLLMGRFLQGFCSGCLIPLSQSLLISIYPSHKRGLAIGIWGLVAMVGPVIGPTLGGWITDNYGWGWIFYINVPIGIFSGIVTFALMRDRETKREKIPVDKMGLTLFWVGIAALQLMLDRGNDLDWFGNSWIVFLTIVSVICLTFFVIWEIYHPAPIIDIKLFKDLNFTVGTFTASFGMAIIFASLIVEPLWVQAQLDYTPLWSGLTLAPFGIFAVILFPLLGRYLHLFNLKILIASSLLLFAWSNFVMSNLYLQVPYWAISWPRLLQGAAFAFLFVPITSIALSNVSAEKTASGAGIFSFMRMLFVGIGVSLSVTFWQRRAQFYHSRLAESAIPSNPAYGEYVGDLAQLDITGQKATGVIYDELVRQAFTFSMLDLFYLSAWMCLLMILIVFIIRTPKTRSSVILD